MMEHLAQSLHALLVEGAINGVRVMGASPECLLKAFLIELVDGVAGRLRIAAEIVGDLVSVLAIGTGEQYLATAQGEGIRRTQACLQGLTLGVAQWTHKDWSFHALEDNPQLRSCLGMH
jgi:hypothetical protein